MINFEFSRCTRRSCCTAEI